MRVLVERERRGPAMLDRIAQAMQRAHAGISAPGEGQRAGATHADQLVVDEIGRHPHQVQVAATLAYQLMAGGERDEMRETLERDLRAVGHETRYRFRQRQEFDGHSTTVRDCSRRYSGR